MGAIMTTIGRPPTAVPDYRPATAAETMSSRSRVSDRAMTQHRYRQVCEKIVGDLAYVRPEDPYVYLEGWLDDPEGAVPTQCLKIAEERSHAGQNNNSPEAITG